MEQEGPTKRDRIERPIAPDGGTDPVRVGRALRERIKELNRQLAIERQALQETNTALRTVLTGIEEEKREIYRDIHANVEKVILPILHALAVEAPKSQRHYLDLLRDSIEDIASPFINAISRKYTKLTPTELRICKMIRDGLRTKEIARLRGISPATVSRHREHIRRKLGLANAEVNLVTHLQATL